MSLTLDVKIRGEGESSFRIRDENGGVNVRQERVSPVVGRQIV